MDDDQCARRNLQLFFGIKDPDYYEFEGRYKAHNISFNNVKTVHVYN